MTPTHILLGLVMPVQRKRNYTSRTSKAAHNRVSAILILDKAHPEGLLLA